jgi:large subunit ribosomal protein L5
MRDIYLDKVILHGSTADQPKLEKYFKLLKILSGKQPVKTKATERIPVFKVRPGLPIGCRVTLRKEEASNTLKNVLTGLTELKESCFGDGYLNFGIKEYIEIASMQFQRDIGILGFDVSAVLKRKGYNIQERKRTKGKIGKKHRITREETIEFFKKNFNVQIK